MIIDKTFQQAPGALEGFDSPLSFEDEGRRLGFSLVELLALAGPKGIAAVGVGVARSDLSQLEPPAAGAPLGVLALPSPVLMLRGEEPGLGTLLHTSEAALLALVAQAGGPGTPTDDTGLRLPAATVHDVPHDVTGMAAIERQLEELHGQRALAISDLASDSAFGRFVEFLPRGVRAFIVEAVPVLPVAALEGAPTTASSRLVDAYRRVASAAELLRASTRDETASVAARAPYEVTLTQRLQELFAASRAFEAALQEADLKLALTPKKALVPVTPAAGAQAAAAWLGDCRHERRLQLHDDFTLVLSASETRRFLLTQEVALEILRVAVVELQQCERYPVERRNDAAACRTLIEAVLGPAGYTDYRTGGSDDLRAAIIRHAEGLYVSSLAKLDAVLIHLTEGMRMTPGERDRFDRFLVHHLGTRLGPVKELEAELGTMDIMTELMALTDAVAHKADALASPLPEIWRKERPDETAADFFRRVYEPLPFSERPFADDVRRHDYTFYNALAAHLANNRRFSRIGAPGTIEGARSLKQLFPHREERLRRPGSSRRTPAPATRKRDTARTNQTVA